VFERVTNELRNVIPRWRASCAPELLEAAQRRAGSLPPVIDGSASVGG
jgi:hypothetical protein